ncbi:MAG: hypothetical protein INH37_01295 [Myxococcaceae bacterium]|nr:hypothetical protein [Myxococcaceae bacterium]
MRARVLVGLWLVAGLGCGGVAPTTMEFVEITPAQPRIGEIVTVRFRLLDERGTPLAGAQVDFKLQSPNGGVSLSPATASSVRGTGFAETQLQASARVNSVIVVATSGSKTVSSPPITFAGAVPNQAQFTFQCGKIGGEGTGGVHAIHAYDVARNLLAGIKLDCTAHVGDRNGDGVEGALISFLTEAGTIGPTEVSASNVVGDATVLYKTSLPLPKDVDPENFTWTPTQGERQTGEYLAPLWMLPFEGVPNPIIFPRPNPAPNPREPNRVDSVPNRRKPDGTQQRLNPRDNLVTMIAVTSGEEAFTDSNNNGQWDREEPFEDLTEPFVDSDDDGTWDPDERFIDVNGDKAWTGKNGTYDPNTLIWRAERILWTGVPSVWEGQAPSPTFGVTNQSPPGPISFVCPGATSTFCSQASPANSTVGFYALDVYLADPWYNAPAQNGDDDGCGVTKAQGVGSPGDPPVLVQTLGLSGEGSRAFVYPAGLSVRLTIMDARDPDATAMTQIPPRRPPVVFTVPLACRFTASQKDALRNTIVLGQVSGTIE